MSRHYFYLLITFLFLVPIITHSKPTITNLSGHATLDGEQIKRGTELKGEQVLNTRFGDTSFVDVKLSDKKKLRLQNAKVTFEEITKSLEVSIDRGKLFYASDTESKDFQVNTPHAIAGVRGTKFYLKSTSEEAYVCVCEGTVHAHKTGFFHQLFGREIQINKGFDAHIYGDKSLPEPKRSPRMIDWTWESLKEMGFERSEQ